MSVLNELLSPIPIPLLAVGVFGLIFIVLAVRYFRFPAHFKMKEELRDEIRFRLTSESVAAALRQPDAAAPAESGGAGAAAAPDAAAAAAAAPDGGAAKKS